MYKIKKTIKELHGDLYEEGTEFSISSEHGEFKKDPDTVWISRQDFKILGARPVDMHSRTFFLFYKNEERRRIVTIDSELKQGQLKLNHRDFGSFIQMLNVSRVRLFRPYPLLLEQYLIFEKLCTPHNKMKRYMLIVEGRKHYRKLLLFYYFMYTFRNGVEMTDTSMIYRIMLQMELVERKLVDKIQDHMIDTMYMFYRALDNCVPALALPLKVPDLTIDDVERLTELVDKCGTVKRLLKRFRNTRKIWNEKSILPMDYKHWNELKDIREYFIRGDSTRRERLMAQIDVILTMWENDIAPVIKRWESWKSFEIKMRNEV